MAKFKRILLKLSGESLMGKQSFGSDPERLSDYAKQIKEVHEMGVDVYKRQTRRRFLTKNYNKRNSYGKGDYI